MPQEITYIQPQIEMFFQNTAYKFKFFPKGRRLGFTRGASQACIEWMLEGQSPLLWGDTSYANIERYIERYWKPVLEENQIFWEWDKQDHIIKIGKSLIDFRSADNPEHWEGFGYKKIILNEAGIILKNRQLYDNTVLPMLIDFPESQLIAGGTPKGKRVKSDIAYYYELCKKAKYTDNYYTKTYTTYDNPYLSQKDIDIITEDKTSRWVRQEIYGEFIDNLDSLINPDWIQYQSIIPDNLRVYIGVDLAVSQKDTADFTSLLVLGTNVKGELFLLDIKRGHWTLYETLEEIIKLSAHYSPVAVGVEAVQYQTVVVQELLRKTKLNAKAITVTKDKLTRFLPIATRYERGMVYHCGKFREFEQELLSFPSSSHDDQVDSFSIAFEVSKQTANRLRKFE
jgi:predicted phage terminase large subunit-like protein